MIKAVQHADELKEEFAKLKDEVAATKVNMHLS